MLTWGLVRREVRCFGSSYLRTSGEKLLRYTVASRKRMLSCRMPQLKVFSGAVAQEARLRRTFAGLGSVSLRRFSVQPARRASATAANCELTPSLRRIDLICERTVEIDTYAVFAISSAQ